MPGPIARRIAILIDSRANTRGFQRATAQTQRMSRVTANFSQQTQRASQSVAVLGNRVARLGRSQGVTFRAMGASLPRAPRLADVSGQVATELDKVAKRSELAGQGMGMLGRAGSFFFRQVRGQVAGSAEELAAFQDSAQAARRGFVDFGSQVGRFSTEFMELTSRARNQFRRFLELGPMAQQTFIPFMRQGLVDLTEQGIPRFEARFLRAMRTIQTVAPQALRAPNFEAFGTQLSAQNLGDQARSQALQALPPADRGRMRGQIEEFLRLSRGQQQQVMQAFNRLEQAAGPRPPRSRIGRAMGLGMGGFQRQGIQFRNLTQRASQFSEEFIRRLESSGRSLRQFANLSSSQQQRVTNELQQMGQAADQFTRQFDRQMRRARTPGGRFLNFVGTMRQRVAGHFQTMQARMQSFIFSTFSLFIAGMNFRMVIMVIQGLIQAASDFFQTSIRMENAFGRLSGRANQLANAMAGVNNVTRNVSRDIVSQFGTALREIGITSEREVLDMSERLSRLADVVGKIAFKGPTESAKALRQAIEGNTDQLSKFLAGLNLTEERLDEIARRRLGQAFSELEKAEQARIVLEVAGPRAQEMLEELPQGVRDARDAIDRLSSSWTSLRQTMGRAFTSSRVMVETIRLLGTVLKGLNALLNIRIPLIGRLANLAAVMTMLISTVMGIMVTFLAAQKVVELLGIALEGTALKSLALAAANSTLGIRLRLAKMRMWAYIRSLFAMRRATTTGIVANAEMADVVGDRLVPALRRGLTWLRAMAATLRTRFVFALRGGTDWVRRFARALGMHVAAASGTAVGWLRRVGQTVTATLIPAMKRGIVWIGRMTAAVARLAIAFLATPAGWITATIAALAAGAFLVVRNWDKVSRFFTQTLPGSLERIRDFAARVGEILIRPFETVWAFVRDLFTVKIPDLFNRFLAFIKDIPRKTYSALTSIPILGDVIDITGQGIGRLATALSSNSGQRAAQTAEGFARGGFTGDVPASQPAGIVHGGEFVVPARMVDRFPRLIALLEGMRTGRTSEFQEGGLVNSIGQAIGGGIGKIGQIAGDVPGRLRNLSAGLIPQVRRAKNRLSNEFLFANARFIELLSNPTKGRVLYKSEDILRQLLAGGIGVPPERLAGETQKRLSSPLLRKVNEKLFGLASKARLMASRALSGPIIDAVAQGVGLARGDIGLPRAISRFVGDVGGGIAGAQLGATAGSAVLPGFGTGVGGLIGAMGGAFLGREATQRSLLPVLENLPRIGQAIQAGGQRAIEGVGRVDNILRDLGTGIGGFVQRNVFQPLGLAGGLGGGGFPQPPIVTPMPAQPAAGAGESPISLSIGDIHVSVEGAADEAEAERQGRAAGRAAMNEIESEVVDLLNRALGGLIEERPPTRNRRDAR